LLKYLRRRDPIGGFAHAFNGSLQQAQQFVDLGFALGMGGAMTFSRALQIRRIAQTISLESLVLETDSPDIAPAWLTIDRRNTPDQVLGVAIQLAELRGQTVDQIIEATGLTAKRICPKLESIF
jgi:TatD DNase family protein